MFVYLCTLLTEGRVAQEDRRSRGKSGLCLLTVQQPEGW